MKPYGLLLITLLFGSNLALAAGTADQMQQQFEQQSGPASPQAGQQFWQQTHPAPKGGKPRSCTSCHGLDLSKVGKHIRTNKRIEPMAPSVNPQRLSSSKKVHKWLKRNCKWTVGRECTPQEKANLLSYLKSL